MSFSQAAVDLWVNMITAIPLGFSTRWISRKAWVSSRSKCFLEISSLSLPPPQRAGLWTISSSLGVSLVLKASG